MTVILIALAFFMGGFTMFALAFVTTGAWRWMGIIGGVIAIGAGIAALVWPKPTLVVLGVFVAWYLLFRGIFDIAVALSNRHVRGRWLGLVAGIIAIGLGAWAIGNPERSTLLLITIIGIWTIFKGVFDLVAVFHYRDMKKALGVDRRRGGALAVSRPCPCPSPSAPARTRGMASSASGESMSATERGCASENTAWRTLPNPRGATPRLFAEDGEEDLGLVVAEAGQRGGGRRGRRHPTPWSRSRLAKTNRTKA